VPKSTPIAPDVCDIVEYGLNSFGTKVQTWRVCSWLREAPPPPPPVTDEEKLADELIREVIAEEDAKRTTPRAPKMQWCTREEATHVSLYSICGTIAPIEECTVIGTVDWSPEQIEQERQRALRLANEHQILW
jgi:hypothetical protein